MRVHVSEKKVESHQGRHLVSTSGLHGRSTHVYLHINACTDTNVHPQIHTDNGVKLEWAVRGWVSATETFAAGGGWILTDAYGRSLGLISKPLLIA